TGPIEDNCPTIPNPDQSSSDGKIGDACRCPVLRVDTVRAFTDSRVRVPVDFEPGTLSVASTNFVVDARAGLGTIAYQRCEAGPIVETARAGLSCVEGPPDLIQTFVVDAGSRPIRSLDAGQIVAQEFAVAPSTAGRSFQVCVDPATVVYG